MVAHLSPAALALLFLAAHPQAPDPAPAAAAAPASTPLDVADALETAIADAIARSEASVVAIARDKDGKSELTTAIRGRPPVNRPNPEQPDPFGPNPFRMIEEPIPDYVASDYATGVVIGDQNQILTTAHAVKGASKLIVRAAGVPAFEAEVIASDPRSDLAVIAPRDQPPTPRFTLKPIKFAPPGKLRKGCFLIALGNPFNAGQDGQASASWGILANTTRRLNPPPDRVPSSYQLRHYPTLLQLDAKLNLGMSGGAVVNLKGEMVGLTTNAVNAGGFDAQAGYAIPLDRLTLRAIDTLRQGREVEYGFLGIGLSGDNSNRISTVQPGTPAAEAGLLINDEVASIEGLPVADAESLVTTVNVFAPGVPVHLKVRRRGEELEKTVILSKLPLQGEVIATTRPTAWRGLRVDYVSGMPRGPFNDAVLEALTHGGVRIAEVQPSTPAAAAGLRVGQLVVAVDGQKIRNPGEFAAAVGSRPGPVTLTLETDEMVTVPAK